MSSSVAELRPLARDVAITENEVQVDLADGRRISVPLAWFPRLIEASPRARQKWELLGDGEGIHWPEADEDLSVAGLLSGAHETASGELPTDRAPGMAQASHRRPLGEDGG